MKRSSSSGLTRRVDSRAPAEASRAGARKARARRTVSNCLLAAALTLIGASTFLISASPAAGGGETVVTDAARHHPWGGTRGARDHATRGHRAAPAQSTPVAPPAAGTTAPAAPPSSSAPAPAATAAESTSAGSAAAVPASNAVRPPGGIAADCSTDVTDSLTRWVNSLPDGSSILFASNGCYLVNGSITVSNKAGLVIDGNGSTFKATRPVASPEMNRAQWHANYGRDLTFRNMTLVGIHPTSRPYDGAYEFDHNLFIRGTQGVLVDRIVARNAYGDNLAIAQGLDWETIPGDITITNSVFDGAGRMGVSCVACRDVTVDNNTISNTAIFSFDLEIEGHNWPGTNVRFTDNVISGTLGGAMFSIGAPVDWAGVDIRDVYIAGNRMTTYSDGSFDCTPAISLKDSRSHVTGLTIENNELNSITDGILVKNASDVVVRNNVIHHRDGCGGNVGVRLVAVSGGQVSGNTAVGFPIPYRQEP